MEFQTKINYIEEYLPTPRHRKLRERTVQEEITFEIEETTTDRAPVALRTHDIKHYCDGIQASDYRYYNGTLYTALRLCDMRVPDDYNEANKPFPVELIGQYYHSYGRHTRDEALKAVSDFARRFLLIDGFLWERAREPMYEICTFGLGHNHAGIGTALMITDHFNDNCRWTSYFTALQQEEAIAAAVKTAIARGDDKSIDSIQDRRYRIEVLDPSVIKADPKAWGGKGDPLHNLFSEITAAADSAFEAGLLAMAAVDTKISVPNTKLQLSEKIRAAEESVQKEEDVVDEPNKTMRRER